MKNVKITKGKILLFFSIILVSYGCKLKKANRIKPFVISVNFKNYGIIDTDYKKMKEKWRNHLKDSIIYFNVNLINKKIVVKSSLVATRYPFQFIYKKASKNKTTLVIVHQFNTIYCDSIIIEKPNRNLIKIPKAYSVCSYYYGIDEVCRIKKSFNKDTLDISQGVYNCFERKRK